VTRRPLPDPELLRSAPECSALCSLDFALALTDTALRLEHPTLGADYIPLRPLPPQSLLLAQLLLEHGREMRNLIARYNAAVDDALGLHDCDHSDSLSDIPW
jgi:hypothetical protein